MSWPSSVAIRFLTLEQIHAIHRDMVARYGGEPGVLNASMVESAAAMPQAGFGDSYFHSFPFGMAAAYAFHLAANHGFADGNKRVGFVAADVFLELNGWELPEAGEAGFRDLILAAAAGAGNKADIEAFLAEHAVRTA
ncbi:MAG: type II toxin-antitoxin system death-on-curing family toxin [Armatimonadetes bacterium]|nr:type II toxin-antitoxin system death-on-curing family toxin [Armatimonadota bacterium]